MVGSFIWATIFERLKLGEHPIFFSKFLAKSFVNRYIGKVKKYGSLVYAPVAATKILKFCGHFDFCFNRMHQWVFRFLFCILAYVLINSIIKVCIRNTLTLKFWEKKIGCSPSFSLSKKFAQINDPTMATYDPHFYHRICFSYTNVDVWK